MNPILKLSPEDRVFIFRKTQSRLHLPIGYVEKDFWVVFLLHYLFEESSYRSFFLFKGGTCLSKCYDLIHRFSEDVDISINWDLLPYSNNQPLLERNRSQRKKFNDEARKETAQFIRDTLLPAFQEDFSKDLGKPARLEIDSADPLTILFAYESLFPNAGIAPQVRLELGSLSARGPRSAKEVTAYCDVDALISFRPQPFQVYALDPLRIFWEKASILYQVSQRPLEKPIPRHYFRHYSDFYHFAHSPYYAEAIKRTDIRNDVLLMDQTFYPNTWMDYQRAKGTFSLVPPPERFPELEADKENMKGMFFEESPALETIINQLKISEKELAQNAGRTL
jgi:hypothetical protein